MDRDKYITLFNEKTEEFVKELTQSFPNVKQFTYFKSGFMFLRNMDKNKPQEVFHKYIYLKYKDKLIAGDEEFFLKENYAVSKDKQEDWEEFIDNIRDIWKTLDEPSKEAIWKYFKVLVFLNEKCLA
jgi:hypothetical protein